ncbi:MAG TPA: TonB-dependent receptor, partial [Geobacterales bacterium]|nr:TonB-dependent receptor [Geobacterales bacterium]
MPRRSTFFLLLLSLLAAATLPAAAVSDEEMQVLRMFYPESELVVTPTRTPKPISQVAENITVISRKEIDAIHPHTLADILLLVPGVQIDMRGGPGSQASARIQGSGFRHVLLLVDGVRQNYLSNNFADIAAIPVEEIERIEIVKGPGSSAWGSALGGVINVITRESPDERGAEGELQGAMGERKTNALRGYAAGAGDTVAGVAAASYLHSDGLTPHTAVEGDQGYARLRWQPTERTTLRLTAMGSDNQQGSGFYPPRNLVFDDESSSLQVTALLNQAVTDSFDLEVALRSVKRNLDQRQTFLLSGSELLSKEEDRVQGGSLKGTWRLGPHQLLLGSDLERGEIDSDYVGPGQRVVEQYAFFANDSMLFGPLSVTPGIRFDHTSTSGDFVSPSLGLTWGVAEQSVFRLAVARGFTSPPLSAIYGDGVTIPANPGLKAERVWSYQGGVETSIIPYLWLKGTIFRHDIS